MEGQRAGLIHLMPPDQLQAPSPQLCLLAKGPGLLCRPCVTVRTCKTCVSRWAAVNGQRFRVNDLAESH